MYGTAPAFSGGRGSYRAADVRPAEMNRPDGQAGGVVHVFPNGTVLGHWSHIGGSGGPSPSRRATGTPALVYAESVMQHSPGLSALSGLPWVSGRFSDPNPGGVLQTRHGFNTQAFQVVDHLLNPYRGMSLAQETLVLLPLKGYENERE